MSKVSISLAAQTLLAIDNRIKELDREIEDMAVKISVMQEHRAALGEECRTLEKKARQLMVQFGARR